MEKTILMDEIRINGLALLVKWLHFIFEFELSKKGDKL
jgi:hypothetical protein